MRCSVAVLSALALLSCGDAPEADTEGATAEALIAVEPDGGTGDGAVAPPPITMPLLIPRKFHGVWDYIYGQCEPESDMRMEISDKDILFYESIGTLTELTLEGDDVIVTLAMEGEGETWTQRTRLSLTGSGEEERLLTSDGDLPKSDDQYPAKRCPS